MRIKNALNMYRNNVHRSQYISDRQCKQCRLISLVAQNLGFYNKKITTIDRLDCHPTLALGCLVGVSGQGGAVFGGVLQRLCSRLQP